MWFTGLHSFPSCWVFSTISFIFLWRFLRCQQFFSIFVNSSKLFASVFLKACLQTCLTIPLTASLLCWIHTIPLRLPVVNPIPQLCQFPYYCHPLLRHYRCPLQSASQWRLCHRPFPNPFSSHSLKCWRLFGRMERQLWQLWSSTSGNSGAAKFLQ